ncbi:MAG: InlB B-repeat-containing protein [Saccharofermentanales bacterium]|jgi:hypothetical protein
MSKIIDFSKRLTVALLCLLLLSSLMFIGTKEVAAVDNLNKVEITTDRSLHQYTDIAVFLKSVKLNLPDKSYVDSFTYDLMFFGSDSNPIFVTSGKADAQKYIFEIEITLKDGHSFDSFDNIHATLNGASITFMGATPQGSNYITGWWELIALPRYKVTFDTDGGDPTPAVQWVVQGKKVKVPKQPAKAGYEFLGWWHDVPKFSEQWDFNRELNQDLPLIAHWKALPTTTTTTTTATTTTSLTTEATTPVPTDPPTTTSLTTEATTPVPTDPPTTTPESPETTTEATDLTTTTEAVVPDTSNDESEETTPPSNEIKKGDGFSLTTFLFTLGGVILLAAFGFAMYKIGQRKK